MPVAFLKRYLPLAGMAALTLHFSFILIFCLRQHISHPALLKISQKYVIPLFNQEWQMFAPEPPLSERHLYYRCLFNDGSYSAWINPGKPLLEKLQYNRFWNYQVKFAAHQSILRELKYADFNVKYLLKKKQDADSLFNLQNKYMRESAEYKMAALYLTRKASGQFPGKKINTIDFMYVTSRLPAISNKTSKRIPEAIVFPTIHAADKHK